MGRRRISLVGVEGSDGSMASGDKFVNKLARWIFIPSAHLAAGSIHHTRVAVVF